MNQRKFSRQLAAIGFAVLLLGSAVSAQEFRAFWVDSWGAGILNASQVRTLLGTPGDPNDRGRIREANCNAVVVQVRRRADVCYPSAMGEPYMSGLSPSNFNALQAIINAAHDTTGGKQRIEVHCWSVAFKTAKGVVYSRHSDPSNPENYWPTRLDSTTGSENGDGAFDPGHPRCLEYLVNVHMDLVTNFDIDGIHYDYIRFEARNEGYNPTSVARYNARYGLSGDPPWSSEQFKQWRRDQVTAFVRQMYARIQAVKPHVKQSGSFVTWNPSPTSSTRAAFRATRPYYDVYSDWDSWMQEGLFDISMPMTYYNWASLPNDYVRWMNFEKDRKGNRHMVIGPGIYLNSLSNAIRELQMTRDPSPAGNYADGFCGYSYRVPFNGGNWTDFAAELVSDVTPTPAQIPVMPWKTTPTKGHMMGTVTYSGSGTWADGATVTLTSGPENRTILCDGTGFYAFIDLTPGTYTVTVSKAGYADTSADVTVTAGQMAQRNFQLSTGPTPPAISGVGASNITNNAATITWVTDQPATSQVQYGLTTSYGSQSPIDSDQVTNHSVTISGLQPDQIYHYRVISGNANGTTTSGDFTFKTQGPPQIQNVEVTVGSIGATITWQTTSPADSVVDYGLSSSYTDAVGNPAQVTSHTVALVGLQPDTTYHYRVSSTNPYGSAQTSDATFTTLGADVEIIIDNLDPGWANTSPGGAAWSVGSIAEVPKIGTNYLFAGVVPNPDEGAATRKCTWTPNLPVAGRYDVYAYYQIGSNRSRYARYKVFYSGGSVLSIQNQYSTTPNQGGWFLIGENLLFEAGTAGYVELSNNTDVGDTGNVSADAVKFVPRPDTTPPSAPVVSDEGAWTSSTTSLTASWTESIDPESSILRYEYRILRQGGEVVRDWTDAGLDTQVNVTGLTLAPAAIYFFEVRATNSTFLVSDVGASDGIAVFTFDVNGDTRVDATDTASFLVCMSQALVPYSGDAGLECYRFDVDIDEDVDLDDFGVYQRCITGPDAFINPVCLQP